MSNSSAVDNGAELQRQVCKELERQRLHYTKEWTTACVSSFGARIRVDVFVYRAQVYRFYDGLYVECKFQKSGGSVDIKAIALHEQIKHHYDKPTVVVVDGVESEQIYAYLSQRVGGQLYGVFRLDEFSAWLSKLHRKENKTFLF